MWGRLFTSRLHTEPESMARIVDNTGHYYIDNEYRELGEREGWLKKIGWIRDEKGRLVWEYRHIRR